MDSEIRFSVDIGEGRMKQKSCYHAKKNPSGQCKKLDFKKNCPVTCNACLNVDVDGDAKKCKIKAFLHFPQGAGNHGYHKEKLQVEKMNEDQACYSRNNKTNWGCVHAGDAFFDGRGADGFTKKRETINIYNGKEGNFKITVSHVYTEEEVLQADDCGAGRANLIVKVNGKNHNQSIRHTKNKGKETHTDYDVVIDEGAVARNENVGFINPNFNGDYFVEVACDDQCECDIVQKDAECRLKAQLKFPRIADASEYGYHSDM